VTGAELLVNLALVELTLEALVSLRLEMSDVVATKACCPVEALVSLQPEAMVVV
jgi:hypothetical protein